MHGEFVDDTGERPPPPFISPVGALYDLSDNVRSQTECEDQFEANFTFSPPIEKR